MRLLRSAAVLAILAVPVACAKDDAPGAPAGPAAGTGGSVSSGGATGLAGTSGTGGTSGTSGTGGTGGSAGQPPTVVPALRCTADADCTARLPATTPAGCARAVCDVGECVFATVDADADGAAARFCKSNDPAFVIKVGTDCDDGDDAIHPGAWDGPPVGGEPNHCGDGVDQDCSGADGDTVAPNGQSCECIPGDVGACATDASGKPITFPSGGVKGECRQGSRTCVLDSLTGGGRWGACVGAVAPAVEECNGKDDDCDGSVDEEAIDRRTYTCDADSDNHLRKDAQTAIGCAAPKEGCPGTWQETAPVDDCNDSQPLAYSGHSEQCDGFDNNCDGKIDETFACAYKSGPVAATTCPGGPAAADVACKRYCDSICQQGPCFADVQIKGQATSAQQIAGDNCGAGCAEGALAIVPTNKVGGPQPIVSWKVDLPPGKYRVVFDIDGPDHTKNTLGAMYAESKLPASLIGARANSWFNFRQIGGKFTVDLPVDACGQDTILSVASSVDEGGNVVIVRSVSWYCVEGACMTTPAK